MPLKPFGCLGSGELAITDKDYVRGDIRGFTCLGNWSGGGFLSIVSVGEGVCPIPLKVWFSIIFWNLNRLEEPSFVCMPGQRWDFPILMHLLHDAQLSNSWNHIERTN